MCHAFCAKLYIDANIYCNLLVTNIKDYTFANEIIYNNA